MLQLAHYLDLQRSTFLNHTFLETKITVNATNGDKRAPLFGHLMKITVFFSVTLSLIDRPFCLSGILQVPTP
jgi:hypothetical protein